MTESARAGKQFKKGGLFCWLSLVAGVTDVGYCLGTCASPGARSKALPAIHLFVVGCVLLIHLISLAKYAPIRACVCLDLT